MTTKLATIEYPDRTDLPAVLAIEAEAHLAAGRPARAMTAQDVLDFVGEERTRLEVMRTDGGTVVGYLMFDGRDPEVAVVRRLTVAPGERRAGRGLLLLERAVGWARKAGADRLEAHVYEEDADAIAFFRAVGFASRLTRHHFGRGQDAVTFSAKVAELGKKG